MRYIRENYGLSDEVAALLPMKGAWKIAMDSLQICKKVAKLTDFIDCKSEYNESEFSEFNTIFRKKGKFGLIDTNLQVVLIPPIYDFPQNHKGEYEFLEDFVYYFARFQKPNGKKGWLDIFGNEF